MRSLINEAIDQYNLCGHSFYNLSEKTAKIICNEGVYFLKKTNITSDEKFKYLNSLQLNNIIYPINNKRGNYVSFDSIDYYYIMPYTEDLKTIDEVKINKYYNQLSNLHFSTYYRKELSALESKKRLEDIYNYLNYKFGVLESFVRSVEEKQFSEYSILILKDYQYILTAKQVMANLNKKIIDDIKNKKIINRAFIHNNPKLNHLICSTSNNYFISLERSKIGISSLDMAKFYIETEDINIKHKELVEHYFREYDDEFYLNYFYFLVMLYYIKSIIITDIDYVSSQSFIYAGRSLKKFMEEFSLTLKLLR